MARRHRQDQEIPFVSLLDTITNVVGILIIILVTVGIAAATAVKKVMSDLPQIDEQTLIELRELVKAEKTPEDPEEVKKKIEALEKSIVVHDEELKTLDVKDRSVTLAHVEDLEKQLAERTKARDTKKGQVNTMLQELEKLKGILENTPVIDHGPPSVVRLPNPRPYPQDPKELRIFVAKQGTFLLDQQELVSTITTRLNQNRSQLIYRDPAPDPFVPLLKKILGEADAKKAWPDIAGMAGLYQMDAVAKAWKVANDAGMAPSKQLLETAGSLSLATRKPMDQVMAAMIAATKGDYEKWIALDPSTNPATPTIKVEANDGNRVVFYWGSAKEEVRADERNLMNYFKDLANLDRHRDAVKNRVIYDAYKISELIKREANNFTAARAFNIQSEVTPGRTTMLVTLTPKTGETLEQMRQPNSNYVQSLRNLKSNPKGVAVFQVAPDAVPTYLEARSIAEEIGVPAAWNFVSDVQNIPLTIAGFEVQRFAEAPKPGPQRTTISAPKMGLD